MMLGEAQKKFSILVSKLIQESYSRGYTISFGEALRTPEQAAIYAAKGTGIKNSLHTIKLAIDLNIYKNGEWLKDGEQFRDLGEFWESLDPACNWGGRFKDGNHFSYSWKGMKGIK